eukprot:449266-Amphidinium_carterae.1
MSANIPEKNSPPDHTAAKAKDALVAWLPQSLQCCSREALATARLQKHPNSSSPPALQLVAMKILPNWHVIFEARYCEASPQNLSDLV